MLPDICAAENNSCYQTQNKQEAIKTAANSVLKHRPIETSRVQYSSSLRTSFCITAGISHGAKVSATPKLPSPH